MSSGIWELALDHIGNGVVVIDERETIRLISKRAKTLFRIDDGSIGIGHTLGNFLDCVGRSVGWSAERVATVHSNHRAWKSASEAKDIVHHYDDGTVLRIGYHPKVGDGAVLTFDDVTDRTRLDGLLQNRAVKADLFHAEVHSTVGEIARATRETRERHADVSSSAYETLDRIAELNFAAEQSVNVMHDAAHANQGIQRVFGDVVTGLALVSSETSLALAGAQLGSQTCQRLAAHAQSAGTILDLIHGLAEQSRLLSLNARIEAARAGDAGRGFGAVAQAVKELADQTVQAARRTEAEISEIRHAIAEAVEANRQIETSIGGISRVADTVRLTTRGQQAQVEAISAAIDRTATVAQIMRDNVGKVDERFGALIETLVDTSTRLAQIDHQVETLVDGAEHFRQAHIAEDGEKRARP